MLPIFLLLFSQNAWDRNTGFRAIKLPGETAVPILVEGGVGTVHVAAGPDRPLRFHVKGPSTLLVVTRAVFEEGVRQYDVPVWLDHNLEAVFSYKTGVDRGRRMRHGHEEYTIGHRRNGRLKIPPGKHALLIEPTGQVYIRVLQRAMLFPGLNDSAERVPSPDILAHRLPLLSDPDNEMTRIAALIGDPLKREGTLAAHAALESMGIQGGYFSLLEWARELRLYAIHRTVLPQRGETPFNLTEEGFTTPKSAKTEFALMPLPFRRPARLLVDMAEADTAAFLIGFNDSPPTRLEVAKPVEGNIGRIDVSIPRDCGQIFIQQESAGHTHPICFQIASSSAFQLQDPEFSYYAARLGMDFHAWFNSFLDGKTSPTDDSMEELARRNLARHFQSLRRFLESFNQKDPPNSRFLSPSTEKPLSSEEIQDLRVRAKATVDPREAVALWGRVTRASHLVEDRLQLTEALLQSGEHYLAVKHLEQMAGEGIQAGVDRLAHFLRKQRKGMGLPGLYARAYMKSRDRKDLLPLGKALLERRQFHLAKSVAQITGTAFQEPEMAWKEAHVAVTRFSAGAMLYRPGTGRTNRAFKLERGDYMTMRVQGPSHIRIELRPLHSDGGVAIDGGCSLQDDGGLKWIPILGNRPSTAMINPLEPEKTPGRPIAQELNLGVGFHQLVLQADTHPMLVRLYQKPSTTAPFLLEDTAPLALERKALLSGHPTRRQLDMLVAKADQLTDGERELLYSLTGNLEAALLAGFWETALALALARGDAEAFPQPQTAEQGLMALQAFLYLADQRRDLYVRAAAIQDRWPENERIAMLARRLGANTVWQNQRTVDRSAGIRRMDATGPTPNAALRLRESLIPARADEILVRGSSHKTVNLDVSRDRRLELEFSVDSLAGLMPAPVRVTLFLDQMKLKTLRIPPDGKTHGMTVALNQGTHRLRLEVKEAHANQFLRVRIDPGLIQPTFQTWFVATRDQPVTLQVHKPAWFRIEEQDTPRSKISYRFITETPAKLVFQPETGKRTALYRIAKRVRKNEPHEKREPVVIPTPEYLPVAQAPAVWSGLKQERDQPYVSTWSFRTTTRDRTLDDDEEGATQHDRYNEGQMTWRGKLLRGVSRARLRFRQRERDQQTLGLEATHAITDSRGNLWQALFTAYQQHSVNDNDPWSAYLRLRWSHYFRLGRKSNHRPELEVFSRHLSLSEEPSGLRLPIDLDVYSDYKANHRNGLRLKESLYWQPFADSWVRAMARLDLNENFDSLDRTSLDLSWSQLMGPIQLTLASSARYYYADQDRRNDFDTFRHRMELTWSRQRREARRWEARLRIRTDDRGQTDWSLSIGHIFRDRGDYALYAPREVLFRGLKTQRHYDEGGHP